MKTYLYAYHVAPAPRNGSGAKKTVRLYELRRGALHVITERTDAFVDEFQLVQDAMQQAKCKPAAMYAKRPEPGCGRVYGSAREIEAAGLARVWRVGF